MSQQKAKSKSEVTQCTPTIYTMVLPPR